MKNLTLWMLLIGCSLIISFSGCRFIGSRFFGIDTREGIEYVRKGVNKPAKEPIYYREIEGTSFVKRWPQKYGYDYGWAKWERNPNKVNGKSAALKKERGSARIASKGDGPNAVAAGDLQRQANVKQYSNSSIPTGVTSKKKNLPVGYNQIPQTDRSTTAVKINSNQNSNHPQPSNPVDFIPTAGNSLAPQALQKIRTSNQSQNKSNSSNKVPFQLEQTPSLNRSTGYQNQQIPAYLPTESSRFRATRLINRLDSDDTPPTNPLRKAAP